VSSFLGDLHAGLFGWPGGEAKGKRLVLAGKQRDDEMRPTAQTARIARCVQISASLRIIGSLNAANSAMSVPYPLDGAASSQVQCTQPAVPFVAVTFFTS
jgi:hypothetical protein